MSTPSLKKEFYQRPFCLGVVACERVEAEASLPRSVVLHCAVYLYGVKMHMCSHEVHVETGIFLFIRQHQACS